MQTITYYAKPNARAGHGFVPMVSSTFGDRIGSPYSAIGYDLDTALSVAKTWAEELRDRCLGDYDVTIVEG